MNAVTCDYCKQPAELVTGEAIYPHRPDLAHKSFWRCEPCGAYVGCHPADTKAQRGDGNGTKPMGRLANAELRRAKQAAHAAFDPLWLSSNDRRGARAKAYEWLAGAIGVAKPNCHIGMFDVDNCKAVVVAVRNRSQHA